MDEYVKWDRWTVLPRIPGSDKQASFIKSAEDPDFTQFTKFTQITKMVGG